MFVGAMRENSEKVAASSNHSHLSRKCRSLMSMLLMCVSDKEDIVSKSTIGRQLLQSFPITTRWRIINIAGIKRKRFRDNEVSQFRLADKEKKRWKCSDGEMEDLREYMVENTYTRASPQKNDTLTKRDINGEKEQISLFIIIREKTFSTTSFTIPLLRHVGDGVVDEEVNSV